LQARLTAVGLNPINNIVDLTNFIMAELAQPMHAYDRAKFAGDTIFVRSARMGERDARYDSVEERALLAPALAMLPHREQSILRMRFVQGLTQSEIAATIGVSQMHVSRLLAASLEELRRHIDSDTPE